MNHQHLPDDTRVHTVGDRGSDAFFANLLQLNRVAFTGSTDMTQQALSLPGWVLLDCYLMPSAVVGFLQAAKELPASIFSQLAGTHPDDLVPVAAYTAVPSARAGHWIGISLYSLNPGGRVGLRAKALGLLYYGARSQWGITQFDNASIRVHTMLGPLRLMTCQPPIHTLAHKTFTYLLEPPPTEELIKIAFSDAYVPKVPTYAQATWVAVSNQIALVKLRQDISEHPGRFALVYPGARAGPQGQEVCVADLGPDSRPALNA